ncbi:MAG: LysR family transcriptional regulator [Maritimibacter sp.]
MIAKLEMFIALARERHFGRAAESLGITQPTLSAGIKQLEETLGVQLVLRGSRFGGLTPEGQRALIHARTIIGETKHLRQDMRFSREGLSGDVRLAVIPTALTWASKLTARFTQAHPKVTFTILSRATVDIVEILENFEIDVGMTYLDQGPLGRVMTQGIYRESYALVCHKESENARQAAVEWADVAKLNLCLLTPDMQNRRIINRAFLDAGLDPKVGMESNSTVVLTSHTETGQWATVLPVDLARTLAAGRALSVVPIRAQNALEPSVGLVAPHQDPQTPVLKAIFDQALTLSTSRLAAG